MEKQRDKAARRLQRKEQAASGATEPDTGADLDSDEPMMHPSDASSPGRE